MNRGHPPQSLPNPEKSPPRTHLRRIGTRLASSVASSKFGRRISGRPNQFFQRDRTMSAISKDQAKRDEETLALFLVFFNLMLLGVFVVICFAR
jgi:hypothetical protein